MSDIKNAVSSVQSSVSIKQLVWSLIFIAIGVAEWLIVKKIRNSIAARIPGSTPVDMQKKHAIRNIGRIIKLLIIIVTALVVLQINGINVSSLAASMGIAGAAVSLAWQDVIKDIIQGVRITTDGFFSVGDCIRYSGDDYQVTDFTIRTTRLRRLYNGDVTVVCNRNLSEVTKLSGKEYITIGFAYEDDSEKIDALLQQCVKKISVLPGIKGAEYLGLQCFSSSSIGYLLGITGNPAERAGNIRRALRIIRDEMKQEGIELPFDQITIHNATE